MEAPSLNPPARNPMAAASLVCGIGALILGPLTGIPAIITGHIALSRMRKTGSGGPAKSKAVVGLVLGYVLSILPLVIVSFMIVGNNALARAREMTTMLIATSIEEAVNNYYLEYGRMPLDGDEDIVIRTDQNVALLKVLLGKDLERNPRGIQFLITKEGSRGKDGLIYNPKGGGVTGLYDPWGGGFRVHLDLDSDNSIFVEGPNGGKLSGIRVAVSSDGVDRLPGTADDIRTW